MYTSYIDIVREEKYKPCINSDFLLDALTVTIMCSANSCDVKTCINMYNYVCA